MSQTFMSIRRALCPGAAAPAWVPQALRALAEKLCELMRTKALWSSVPHTSSKSLLANQN